MSAVLFLFRRKLAYVARWGLLFIGYEAKRTDVVERLYGLYAIIIFAGWALAMVSWSVVTVTSALRPAGLSAAGVYPWLFAGAGLWLAITPWLAQRSFNLQRFSGADLDFLSGAPVPVATVSTWWLLKRLFRAWNGWLVLACGVLASSLAELEGANDVAALALGLAAGALFVVAANAPVWLMGLLRYRPAPLFGPAVGVGLTLAAMAALLWLPWANLVFWPAWLASLMIAGTAPASEMPYAVAGLALTAALGIVATVLVARGTLLVPAFEEARLGRQITRRPARSRAPEASPGVQIHAGRRPVGRAASSGWPSGPLGALLRKEALRLRRTPPLQLAFTLIAPLVLGAGLATALAMLGQTGLRIEIVAPAAFFANFVLLRLGLVTLRSDLARLDFFAGWPLSRLRLSLYDLLAGFFLQLAGGEIALLAGGIASLGWATTGIWLALWPLLLAVSALTALLEIQFRLRRQPPTEEALPEAGPIVLVVAGAIWLAAILGGPANGLMIAAAALFVYSVVLGVSRAW